MFSDSISSVKFQIFNQKGNQPKYVSQWVYMTAREKRDRNQTEVYTTAYLQLAPCFLLSFHMFFNMGVNWLVVLPRKSFCNFEKNLILEALFSFTILDDVLQYSSIRTCHAFIFTRQNIFDLKVIHLAPKSVHPIPTLCQFTWVQKSHLDQPVYSVSI